MLHPSYKCECQNPSPLKHLGEDTGLCQACNCIFDERLYEMRLRQHTTNFRWESVEAFLTEVDPHYQQLVSQ